MEGRTTRSTQPKKSMKKPIFQPERQGVYATARRKMESKVRFVRREWGRS